MRLHTRYAKHLGGNILTIVDGTMFLATCFELLPNLVISMLKGLNYKS